MKKIFSILLLIVFLFNISGFYIVLELAEKSNREQIHALIKNKKIKLNDIQLLAIKKSNAKRGVTVEPMVGNEMSYNGELYDVISEKDSCGFTYFYCYNDQKEEKLISKLADYVENNVASQTKSGNNDTSKQLVKNIVKDYFSHWNYISQLTVGNGNVIYRNPQGLYVSTYMEIFIPPPKLV